MASLGGKVIAITEGRRARELATLVEKLGGVPYAAPAVREVPRADQGPALAALGKIESGDVDMIVFLTGVGARALLTLAADEGCDAVFRERLERLVVVARGPKPVAVLREAGVRIDVVPGEPTSEGVLEALRARALDGLTIAVQLHGDESPVLVERLRARGAHVIEIPLYEWALPEDQAPVERLVDDLIDRRIDVIAFTSSPQIRHVLAIAERLARREPVLRALRDDVVVAVVGPVCRATLAEHGVAPAIEPVKGTMGALVHAIVEHVDRSAVTREAGP